MATPPFFYQKLFELGEDDTEYRLLTEEFVSVGTFEGKSILKVEPEGLAHLIKTAMHDLSFMLRPKHLEQVAAILDDEAASENDRHVAMTLLRNAEIAAQGVLPFCQDTGTAIVMGKKGQQVWTGGDDESAISKGIYDTYTNDNLRYSQTAPITMYEEKNTRTNLPAQIELYATGGSEYKFLCLAKGGGSANKTFLYQETRALLNPEKLESFLAEKMITLGTSACPPYHLVFVIGGTSAEACLKTVKVASTKDLDTLPTTGNEHGRAFRYVELEERMLARAQECGIGAQFGGRYFALDVHIGLYK